MNLKEIYRNHKRSIDYGYMEMYNHIRHEIELDNDIKLDDDEIDELIVDLMLSSVLGEIKSFNEVK